jgi:hypothetical protein
MGIRPSADRIEQVAFGFMMSKVLFCALEFGLFTELSKGELDADELQLRLKLYPRSTRDFLDTLVAAGLLERSAKFYSNTSETDFYLDRAKPTYIGDFYQFWNVRNYPLFGSLSDGLRTGKPRMRSNVAKTTGLKRCMRPGATARVPPWDDRAQPAFRDGHRAKIPVVKVQELRRYRPRRGMPSGVGRAGKSPPDR